MRRQFARVQGSNNAKNYSRVEAEIATSKVTATTFFISEDDIKSEESRSENENENKTAKVENKFKNTETEVVRPKRGSIVTTV